MDFRDLQAKNRRMTWLLLFASFLLLALVASIVAYITIGGIVAVVIAIVISFGLTWMSYRSSDTIALRATGARPADEREYRRLHNIVEGISIAAGVPKPRVYVIDDPAPNAFATGKDPEHAAVAATTGLIEKLNRAELEGVMAHEMAHVRNYDIRVMTVAVATAGAIALIADLFWRLLYFGGINGGRRRGNNRSGGGAVALLAIVGFVFVVVLAPLAAGLMRAAISREREGLADATGVELTRNPMGLRRALEKLDADVTVVRRTSHATSHLWIETPDDHQKGHKGRRFNDMFNTHPPLRERINVLRSMEGLPAYDGPDPEVVAAVAAAAPARPAVAKPTSWAHLAGAAPAAPAPVEDASAAAPGWHPDPTGVPGRLRWWDGTAWTSHTAGN